MIDFESKHFVGTILIRIKQACNHSVQDDSDGKSYFDGKKRKFQTVVKGRFKSPLPMSHCVTGQTFNRPAGKLPARWIVTAFIKFIATLAPQLEATLDGTKPRFLTPLIATAHTVLTSCDKSLRDSEESDVRDVRFPSDLEAAISEPSSIDTSSIMLAVTKASESSSSEKVNVPDTSRSSIAGRMKARKKVFNALAAAASYDPCKALEPRFDTQTEYTFEFYQHLLDFGDELAVDMGMVGGKVGLAKATDGQPLKIMAAYRDPSRKKSDSGIENTAHNDKLALDTLWSFDLWHESLYPYAEMARETN